MMDGCCKSCGVPLDEEESGPYCWLCVSPIGAPPEPTYAVSIDSQPHRIQRLAEPYTIEVEGRPAEVVGQCRDCDLRVIIYWSHGGIFGHCTTLRGPVT